MPKIALMNTTTGKVENFEPVDAREILNNPNNDTYEVTDEARTMLGSRVPRPEEIGGRGKKKDEELPIDIPNLHGGDEEMQVGLSADKYGRGNVVLAQIGHPDVTTAPELSPEQVAEQDANAAAGRNLSGATPPSGAEGGRGGGTAGGATARSSGAKAAPTTASGAGKAGASDVASKADKS
jgi:hypothetical protein